MTILLNDQLGEHVRQLVEGHLRLVSNVPRRRRRRPVSMAASCMAVFCRCRTMMSKSTVLMVEGARFSEVVADPTKSENRKSESLAPFEIMVLHASERLSVRGGTQERADADGRDEGRRHENKKGSHQLSSH